MSAPPEPSGFTAHLDDGAAQGTDLAVLVCVNDDTTTAFALTADATGTRASYRAILTIHGPGTPPHQLTAGQATHVAHVTRNGLHEARQRYQRLGRVHLFMAVPVGLAMMTGQLLNTVGSVQTYEYIADDQAKPYRPAGLLRPSNPR